MNKNRYRVIFSQARGMFIAVAEIVKSRSKTAGQSFGTVTSAESSQFTPNSYKKLNPLNFAVISVLGAVIYTLPLNSIANTQIIADKSAPNSQQATVLNSGNGLTQVNIQTPSAGGVSRNTYTQFDVGQESAILNNSRNNAQTQLGGWVQGNPWLAGGEAKVILNEVNSSNPSQLKGYLEVAGKSAQVVIANPSGLVCDGCGVINADRFTLTTGQAVMNQGYLESFRVRDGQVTIEGKGLDGSLTPYTDIYTRALNVNAGLYANNLNVALGQNDINVKDQVTPQINAATSNLSSNPNKPNFALDVGQLGGMYAGKIFLVGNENGLGVRNAGSINAVNGTMVLNANGDLINTGDITGKQSNLNLNVTGTVNNSGNIITDQKATLIQADALTNTGVIQTPDELKVQVNHLLDNTSGRLTAARIDLNAENLNNYQGAIQQTGLQGLVLKNNQLDNSLDGKIGVQKPTTSTDPNTGTGSSSSNSQTGQSTSQNEASTGTTEVAVPSTLADGMINVQNKLDNSAGEIYANGGIDLTTNQGLINDNGELGLRNLVVTGDQVSNQSGKIITQSANFDVNTVNNQKGVISSAGILNINSQTNIDNTAGQLTSGDTLILSSKGDLNNSFGTIGSDKTVSLRNQNINNTQGNINSSTNINIQAQQVDNTQGKIVSEQGTTLQSTALTNTEGQVQASSLDIKTGDLTNQKGTLQTTVGDLNLTGKNINNGLGRDDQGVIFSSGNLTAYADQLDSSGTIASKNDLSLNIVNTLNNQGQIAASGNVDVKANQLNASAQSNIAAGSQIDGTTLASPKNLNIKTIQDTQINGMVTASGDANIQAENVHLDQATVVANNINLTAIQAITAEQAKIQAQNNLTAQSGANASIDVAKAQISANQINLSTAKLDNRAGQIVQTGQGSLDLSIADINNRSGKIINNGTKTTITANNLNNTSGEIIQIGDHGLILNVEQLDSNQGVLQSNSAIELTGQTANLDQAKITAQSLKTQSDQLTAKNSQINLGEGTSSSISAKDAILDAADIQSANQNLSIQAENSLSLQNAKVQTAGQNTQALNITASELNTSNAQILNSAQTTIKANHWENTAGQVSANALNAQVTGNLNNQNAILASTNDVNIQAGTLDNQKGLIQSNQGNVTINVQNALDNGTSTDTAGQIIAKQNADITANQLSNAGSIYANKLTQVKSSGLINTGLIAAENDVQLNVDQLQNSGKLIAGMSEKGDLLDQGNLNIQANQSVQSSGTQIAGSQLVITGSNLDLQNSQSQAKQVTLNANMGDINLQNASLNSDTLKLKTTQNLNTNAAKISTGLLDLAAQSWSNQSGQFIQTGSDALNVKLQGNLENQQGVIASNANQININAANINNTAGTIQQGIVSQSLSPDASLNVTTSSTLDNSQGHIFTEHALNLGAGTLVNAAGQIQSKDLNIHANQLENTASGIVSAETVNIKAGTLNNTGATIQSSEGSLNIVADQLNNQNTALSQGLIQSRDQLTVQSNQLTNSGTIYSEKDSQIQAKTDLNNTGLIAAQNNQNINAGQLSNTGTLGAGLNTDGQFNSQGNLSINADQVNSSGRHIATGQLDIIANQDANLAHSRSNAHDIAIQSKTGNVDLTASQVIANQNLDLNAAQLLNTNQATLMSDTLNINAQKWSNQAGTIVSTSENDLNIDIAQGVDFSQGKLLTNAKHLNLNTQGDFNNTDGLIQLGISTDQVTANDIDRHLTINANNVINDQGVITTTGTQNNSVQINAQQNLSNQKGQIVTNGDLTAQANTIDNQSGTLSGGTATLTANTTINNGQGLIDAVQDLNIKSGDLNNQNATLQSREGNINLQATGTLNNGTQSIDAGRISSAKDTSINANILNNSGTIYADHLAVNVQQDLTNTGTIAAQDSADILANNIGSSGSLLAGLNADGTFKNTGNLTLTAQNAVKATGQNLAGQSIQMVGANVDLSASETQAQNVDLKAQTGDLTLAGATVNANQLSLTTPTTLNTSNAKVQTTGLTLNAHDWNNQSGDFAHSSTDNLNINLAGNLNNQSGQIKSNANQLGIAADQILNQNGEIISYGQDFNLKSNTLLVQNSKILANGFVNANIKGQTNLDGAVLQSHGVNLVTDVLSSKSGQLIDLAGTQASNIQVNQAFDNQSGVIVSQNDLSVKAQSLNNQSGQIATTDSKKLELAIQQEIDNTQGLIKSDGVLNVKSAGVTSL